jgi:hypothetical protein
VVIWSEMVANWINREKAKKQGKKRKKKVETG